MTDRATAITGAIGWAVLITGTEWLARRRLRRRSNAWLLSYSALGALAVARGARIGSRTRWVSIPGLLLAAAGYPLGRALLRDRESGPPADGVAHELVAIATVAVVEELTWGAIVEPRLGGRLTGALFAAKHVAIDRRWRRSLGLFLFWSGLSKQRRRWPALALALHVGLNTLGVLRGHRSGRDQF